MRVGHLLGGFGPGPPSLGRVVLEWLTQVGSATPGDLGLRPRSVTKSRGLLILWSLRTLQYPLCSAWHSAGRLRTGTLGCPWCLLGSAWALSRLLCAVQAHSTEQGRGAVHWQVHVMNMLSCMCICVKLDIYYT